MLSVASVENYKLIVELVAAWKHPQTTNSSLFLSGPAAFVCIDTEASGCGFLEYFLFTQVQY